MKCIIVSGLMRSGTSAIAQVLQALNVPMAMAIAPPIGPIKDYDWEDFTLLRALIGKLQAVDHGDPSPRPLPASAQREFRVWLDEYISMRMEHARSISANFKFPIEAIGFKSPMLLPLWLATEQCSSPYPFRRIIMQREEVARRRSLRTVWSQAESAQAMADLDAWMRPMAERCQRDLTVDFDTMRKSPLDTVTQIAGWLGLSGDLHAAAATIRKE